MIPAALQAGLITAEDVVWKSVEVEPIGRSHSVFKISLDGKPIAVLKSFGSRRGETDGEAARERAVAALATTVPALAALLPPALAWTGPGDVVATAYVDSRGDDSDQIGTGGEAALAAGWERLVEAIVAPLAAVHRSTRHLAVPGKTQIPELVRPHPWGLRLFDGDCPPELWQTPRIAGLLARLAADPLLVRNVRRARGAWRPRCLIHADLKFDNTLLIDTPQGPSAIVVDWEMALIGDPAWDLAALAARLPMSRGSQPPWSEANLDGAARLVSAYAAATDLGAQAVAQRLILYTGVWMIMSALQHLSTLDASAPDDDAETLAAAGAATLREADGLTRLLLARFG